MKIDIELPECPARDRTTGICHGSAYFDGKTSRDRFQCAPDTCKWQEHRSNQEPTWV